MEHRQIASDAITVAPLSIQKYNVLPLSWLQKSVENPGCSRRLPDPIEESADPCGWCAQEARPLILGTTLHQCVHEGRLCGLSRSGLTIAQFGLMAQVASAGDDTLGALAERAGIDQSTLSRNLRGLEAAGLLKIAAAEGDLRRRAVWLTDIGARRLEAAIPLWRRAHTELAKWLDPKLARRLSEAAQALAGTS